MKNGPDGSLVEPLILAAGGRDGDLLRLVDEHGLEAITDVLAAEVASRCEPPALQQDVPVGLRVTQGGRTIEHVLTVSSGGVDSRRGPADAAPVHITTDVLCLARSVYGPPSFDGAATRQVTVRPERVTPAADQPSEGRPAREFGIGSRALRGADSPNPAALAAQAVSSAMAGRDRDLGDLALRFGSDKWGVWHWYTQHYDRHFASLRHEPVRVLEIGIGGYYDPAAGGGSLRMWKNYFSRGIVHGLDIYDKSGLDELRLHTFVGSQNDAGFLRDLAEQHGPFDIVIDDGSHVNEHILASFDTLLPHVRPGGWYVIEDIQTSYWPQYGGTSGAQAGPGTSIGLLKQLIDGLEHQEANHPRDFSPSYTDRHVVGLHLYHNLAFIQKGDNNEGTIPPWVKRTPLNYFYPAQNG
ncbi:class I SAM-dependent methyltransferase [Streptomyces rimosus]|uniref:class I SAM-dependent methyltransferase n=1 Tax=Streptomyces rimosus TaxID=1927 RepID=UPI0004BEDDC1|nr:class I SAM-dependent methyltransferase [Streptomyces rimosus]